MSSTDLHCINVLGLLVNAVGAGLLIFFMSPPLDVTKRWRELHILAKRTALT